jgi:hypothetical protein
MRIRTVKPDFWTNERMAALPEFTRLLALGLLNYADDEGYFNANINLIRGTLFPFADESKKILGAIKDLSKLDFIRVGESKDGRKYGWVVHFTEHQRVDKPKPSKIKGLCDFQEESTMSLGLILDASKEEGKGNGREQGNGTGRGKEARAETLEILKSFCSELQIPTSDAEYLWHKWEGSGWKNGTSPIRDWKATIRSWKAANYLPSQKSHATHIKTHRTDSANPPGRYS